MLSLSLLDPSLLILFLVSPIILLSIKASLVRVYASLLFLFIDCYVSSAIYDSSLPRIILKENNNLSI